MADRKEKELSIQSILTIIGIMFGCGGFWTFLQSRMQRRDKIEALCKQVNKVERDGLRTQLLLLILMRPTEQQEILTIAEHYFRKPPEGLGGDWYMSSLFHKWLIEASIDAPIWFEEEN